MGERYDSYYGDKLKELKADCSKCCGLCCAALFFSKMDGFPEDKGAGVACVNLEKDYQCRIHGDLEKYKMKGCIGYDCFGAGQWVTRHIYKGQTWLKGFVDREEMFGVYLVVYQLYQIRFFLTSARRIIAARDLWSDIQNLIGENEAMCGLMPVEILKIDMEEYKDRVNPVLRQAMELLKLEGYVKGRNCPSDFLGKRFHKKDMSGYDLSMKLLIAAGFDGCVFDGANFLGADTRDTDFSNANLRGACFLSQGQVNSARGSRSTKLPDYIDYPVTWK